MIPDILARKSTTPLPRLPSWLAPVEKQITELERKQLGETLRSWLTVWAHHKSADELTLCKLMVLELRGKHRTLVLNRLKHWYNEARDARERKELPKDLQRA